jgi:hypothetical protein
MAYPPGEVTVGRDAIRALWERALANARQSGQESPLPTLISGDIALTSTIAKDGAGARAQVVRRQPDGTWLRLLDQPEFVFLPIDSATSGNREDMAGHSAIVERLPPPDDAFVAGAVSAAAQRVGRELLMTLIPATHKGRT